MASSTIVYYTTLKPIAVPYNKEKHSVHLWIWHHYVSTEICKGSPVELILPNLVILSLNFHNNWNNLHDPWNLRHPYYWRHDYTRSQYFHLSFQNLREYQLSSFLFLIGWIYSEFARSFSIPFFLIGWCTLSSNSLAVFWNWDGPSKGLLNACIAY